MVLPVRSNVFTSARITHRVPSSLFLHPRLISTGSRSKSAEQERQEQIAMELERQALNPERAETAQSGTDNKVGDFVYSYDPSTTNPELEFRTFEEDSKLQGSVDPLFISPANRDISQLLSPMAGGPVHNADKLGPSSKGWTRKHKEVKIGKAAGGSSGKAGGGGGEYDEYERLLRGLRKIQKREEVYGSGEPNPRNHV